MISQAGWWTQTPSATPLQPKNEMLLFGFCSTSYEWPGWSMDSNPILHLSPAKEMKSSFLDYIQLLMISQACRWTWTPSTTCLQPKNEMLIFSLCSTSDDQPGWLMNLNPIFHPSAAKNWNPHFLLRSTSDVGQTGQWTWTPSTTPLQPKKMKCLFLDYVHFWWSAWLIDELEPHLPPLSSQKNKMLNFRLCSTSDDQPGWSMDSNPICHPSPAKKMKCSFLYYIQLLMLARLVNGLKPHLPSLSSQKNEMLTFGLHSTFDDWPGWLMDSNPIHHPSPAKKKKSSSLYYVELLMISQAGWWTRTPSATPLQE